MPDTTNKRYNLIKPTPYNQTEEFQAKVVHAMKNFSYSPSSKKFSSKTKIQSPLVKYSLDDINRWLQSPIQFEENLRKLSNYLYDTHPTYKLIVRYMALLPAYAWSLTIDTSSGKKEKIKKDYLKVLNYIEKLNLKYELMKASIVAYKNDFFFGYELEANNSYFIMPLDNKYCKISSIEDGIYNFAFNFQYFNVYADELNLYPHEFKVKYNKYKEDKDNPWIELDSKKTVCFKTNIDTMYPLPMFSGMFPSLYELEEYKKMKKDRTKNENYLLLHQRIPMDEKNPDLNKFLIDLELASYFHSQASENLPDGIEIVTSPMELTAVKTEKTKNDNDYVTEAMREVYNDGGISQFLFNSDKNTSIGLSKSIMTDEELAFSLLRQMETWMNRKLKQKFPSLKLKFSFLNVTIFNQKDVAEMYLKQAQYGLPVKLEIAATMGFTPLDVINKATIENDILGLHELFIPLMSSHTQSGNAESKGGAPTKSDDELSDSGQVNRDANTDDRRTNG